MNSSLPAALTAFVLSVAFATGAGAERPNIIVIMATCVELSGAGYPGKFNGNVIQPMEGRSLAPTLGTGGGGPDRILMWEHYGSAAIRVGKWKLVRAGKRPWELSNKATPLGFNSVRRRHQLSSAFTNTVA